MDIKEAKKLPIEYFLLTEGFHPSKRNEFELWYASPFRKEATPSFKVSTSKNVWYDFGTGEGGDVITLMMRCRNIPFHEAMRQLEPLALGAGMAASAFQLSTGSSRNVVPTAGGMEILSAKPLSYGPLLDYMHSRMISDDTLIRRYCLAVTYR